jgi:hypothetical protein
MFDGFASHPPQPPPEHPQGLRTRAMLPLLQVQATKATVTFLAHATAYNTLRAAQAAALTWGPAAGPFGPPHARYRDALDAATPLGRLAEAQAHLHAACDRHRAATRQDGLALARGVIVSGYGEVVAGHALAPLVAMQAGWQAGGLGARIDALVGGPDEGGGAAPLEPTSDERVGAAAEVLAVAFSGPGMDAVRAALEGLWAAGRAQDLLAPASARQAVAAALHEAANQHVGREEMQTALDLWASATGGPRITTGADGQ